MEEINNKNSLLKLQRLFAEGIRNPLINNNKIKKVNWASDIILPSQTLLPEDRIELYAQQYWWRIQGAFDEDFESLKKILGQKRYLNLRDKYILAHPSKSFTLRDLGQFLPEFIKKNPVLSKPYTKVCRDLVNYEWAKINSFDAINQKNLTLEDISAESLPKRVFKLQPHVYLLETNYPVNEISHGKRSYQVLSNTIKKSIKKNSSPTKKLLGKKTYLLVYRKNGSVFTITIEAFEFKVLEKFKTGISLQKLFTSKDLNKINSEEKIINLFRKVSSLSLLY